MESDRCDFKPWVKSVDLFFCNQGAPMPQGGSNEYQINADRVWAAEGNGGRTDAEYALGAGAGDSGESELPAVDQECGAGGVARRRGDGVPGQKSERVRYNVSSTSPVL